MSKNNENNNINGMGENNQQSNENTQTTLSVREQRFLDRKNKKEAKEAKNKEKRLKEAANPTLWTRTKGIIIPVGAAIIGFISGGIVASIGKNDSEQINYYDLSSESPSENEES